MIEPVTDAEIEYAESLLLPEGKHFDDERRRVIKDLTTVNVLACPGSGKTTVLLAKLIILAHRMPFSDGRGVCVLTHTNVAIDEITESLGIQASTLFQPPSFFGTFQSFVDRFLAIPACVHYFNKRPDYIDGEKYDTQVGFFFQQLPWDHELRRFVYGQANRNLAGLSSKEKNLKAIDLMKNLKIDFVLHKVFREVGATRAFLDGKPKKGIVSNKYLEVKKVKIKPIKEGIIGFDEAYFIALKYLHDYAAILAKAFQKRFAYVFIDEMQDTDSLQNEVINRLFSTPEVVVQKIGDVNQSIYAGKVRAETIWRMEGPNQLTITGSKRFHETIAKLVRNICIEKNNPLIGCAEVVPKLTPTIIAFKKENIEQVIPRFAELIGEKNLNDHAVRRGRSNVYKAIGWRKHHEDGIGLSTYWNDFNYSDPSKEESSVGFLDMLAVDKLKMLTQGTNYIREHVIRILLRALVITSNRREQNGRNYFYSKTTVLQFLRSHDEGKPYRTLTEHISNWALFDDITILRKSLESYLRNEFIKIFPVQNDQALNDFINAPAMVMNHGKQKQTSNIYQHQLSSGQSVDIRVGTIHGAKGETHTATLYLETTYQGSSEFERLIEFVCGNFDETLALKPRHIESLKMAYVGLTRPSHFLCLGMLAENFTAHEARLAAAGWELDKTLL